ncbi:MAG: hypothetical protein GY927_06260 [bacterium]|nr:hypothetical protein [bacterium]
MKLTLLLMIFLFASTLTHRPDALAATDNKHPSVIAALACIDQMAPIINGRQSTGPDITCDIPVALSEKDLDELFKAALRSARMNDKVRGAAEKYSAGIAKTVTNFRAADCVINLRVKRATIIEALSRNDTALQLPDQPAICDVTTKKHEIQKLTFAFSPKVEMAGGCVAKFALNMGKIDANCRVCVFNRLYLSTKLVSLWANHMSKNAKRILNAQLGDSCNAS